MAGPWQTRALAPSSSRQEGELSGDGGRPQSVSLHEQPGPDLGGTRSALGGGGGKAGCGPGKWPGHSGSDVAVPRPGVGGLLHATVPPGAQCRAAAGRQGTVPGQLCSSSDTRANRRLKTRGLGTGTGLAPALHTECPSSQSSWTLGATSPHGRRRQCWPSPRCAVSPCSPPWALGAQLSGAAWGRPSHRCSRPGCAAAVSPAGVAAAAGKSEAGREHAVLLAPVDSTCRPRGQGTGAPVAQAVQRLERGESGNAVPTAHARVLFHQKLRLLDV